MSILNKATGRSLSAALIVTVTLFAFSVRCDGDETTKVISNCYIRTYNYIRCTGDFNVSDILLEQRQLVDANADQWWQKNFKVLEIFNSDIEVIDENVLQFHGFKFEAILIENATRFRSVTPKALADQKDDLIVFRAINTSLPQYNDLRNDPQNPFQDFKQVIEVYVGKQTRCPSDETLLFPCTCESGELPRTVPNGLYGWSYGISNTFGSIARVTCDNANMTSDQLKKVFENVSRSDHEPKHFDVLSLERTANLTTMPSNVFSDISITALWMDDVTNLKSIHPKAFVSEGSDSSARSLQVLDIKTANFTTASPNEVADLFQAFSSLTNIRFLRLSECGIPFIPAHAFVPDNKDKLLYNLKYLSLSFDRRHHKSGIKFVGSYAFSGAPNLVELGLGRNFIEEFESFAFAFNETSNNQLSIEIGGNPFNDSYGLKANAFSHVKRPVRISFEVDSFAGSDTANDPSLDFMPENVFRPFIEENAENYFEVNYYNVDIWCDCGSKWMFDEMGNLKQSVQNGLRIKRIEGNTIVSDPLSVQCKQKSSFQCLPNCLTFPLAGLIHCGGNNDFNIESTFTNLAQSNPIKNFSKLLFSSKEVKELPKGSFGDFQFESVDFNDSWNLTSIHPDAFGASAKTIKAFSANNTNLTHYPHFGSFPSLEVIKLDDYHTFHLNSSNFDLSESKMHPNEINVMLSNGTMDPETFTKLNNETVMNLFIGERTECATLRCMLQCKPIEFPFDKATVTTILAANPSNKIQTNCYLECSCKIKWLYDSWNDTDSRVGLWIQEYFGDDFYCVPRGANLATDDNFFGVDPSQFNNGSYFKENC